MPKGILLAAAAVCALTGAASGACAAPNVRSTADANANGVATIVEDIIVTAEKRTENLEKVPVAVSAYTSQARDLVGIDTLQDLTKFTPGLEYSTSTDRAYIRGVGRNTNNLASQPGVATYVDGVYNSSVYSIAGDSLFVDRTEVLRGPQGTLYGRNAIGGSINAISRRPTDDWYAEVRADVGNYGVNNFEGAVSGPVVNGLTFRLAAYRNDQAQGYFKNLAGGPSEGGSGPLGGSGWVDYLEGQMEAKLGDSVDVWVKADTEAFNQTYRSSVSTGPYDEGEFPDTNVSPGAAFGFTQPGFTEVGSVTQNPATLADPRVFSTDTPSDSRLSNDYNVTTQMTWHTAWAVDLKYIGGFTQYHYNLTWDFDGTSITSYTVPTVPSLVCFPAAQCPPLVLFPTELANYVEDRAYYSNEINLISTNSGEFQWILGAFQYHEQYFTLLRAAFPNQTQLATPLSASLGPSPPNPSRNIIAEEQHASADSYAAFAQGDWQVIPTVKLTGGVRYTYDQEQAIEGYRLLCLGLPACAPATVYGAYTPALDITQYAISFAPAPAVQGPPTYDATDGFWFRPLGANWSAVTGTAGIEWTPDSESLIYAKYSRGYKAGGFNTSQIIAIPETNPEYIDAYELGFRRDFGGKIQVNAAAFYYNWDGMQIPLTVQPPVGIAYTQFVNLKRVVSYGLELETVWRPLDNWQIMFNYAYLKATIHDATDCFIDSGDQYATEPGDNTTGCPVANPQQSQSVNGQTVPAAPPNKLALSSNYTWRFEPGSLTLSATFAWQDATYYSIFNRSYYQAPAYNTVDLRLLWNDVKNHYTIIVYGKNIFNTLGYDNAAGGLETDQVTLNHTYGLTPPATYGVELQYRL